LEVSWVNENLTKQQRKYLIDIAIDEDKHFARLPVQDIIEVVPTMDISGNPLIKYQNNESGICAYAALASALYCYQFTEAADHVMKLPGKISEEFAYMQFDAIRNILKDIDEQSVYKFFRKIFQTKKLKTKISFQDMASQLQHPDAFALVVLEQSDNHISHAVVISNHYIYDCNTTHALPFSIEGVNCCCGESAHFKSFDSGYIFVPKCETKAYKAWKRIKT
jgi:hypothetical protein